jgi:hypothetical protein
VRWCHHIGGGLDRLDDVNTEKSNGDKLILVVAKGDRDSVALSESVKDAVGARVSGTC